MAFKREKIYMIYKDIVDCYDRFSSHYNDSVEKSIILHYPLYIDGFEKYFEKNKNYEDAIKYYAAIKSDKESTPFEYAIDMMRDSITYYDNGNDDAFISAHKSVMYIMYFLKNELMATKKKKNECMIDTLFRVPGFYVFRSVYVYDEILTLDEDAKKIVDYFDYRYPDFKKSCKVSGKKYTEKELIESLNELKNVCINADRFLKMYVKNVNELTAIGMDAYIENVDQMCKKLYKCAINQE